MFGVKAMLNKIIAAISLTIDYPIYSFIKIADYSREEII